jgi:hypothetical protein
VSGGAENEYVRRPLCRVLFQMEASIQWSLLTAPYPIGFIGDGLTRVVTVALPCSKVRTLLPSGLTLGEQDVTPPGTHPVVFLFHGFTECQWSFPTMLGSMNFHEQTAGIPFTYVWGNLGPYYFMPKLYLDNAFVQMSGRWLWGLDKELAIMEATGSRYTVNSLAGRRLVSLSWSTHENNGHRDIAGYPEFEPVRRMLSQKLITVFPAAVGPWFTLTDFDRRWKLATVRPLRTWLEVDASYMPGLEGGCYPGLDGSPENACVPGSYELNAPWWLSFPYRPMTSP